LAARPRRRLPQGREVIAIPLGALAVLLLVVAALTVRRVFDFLCSLIPPNEHPSKTDDPT
jgi:hypothetical protein